MEKELRIVARPDFDGIVCSVLIRAAENIETDICWIEPGDIRSGNVIISGNDIIANLPYIQGAYMWFDHHVSNRMPSKVKGAFEIAPSAARVVYKYYQAKGRLDNRFDELLVNTDIIDAADLTKDQIKYPEKYPYILLSMTIKNHAYKDQAYWNHLVVLLCEKSVPEILKIPDIIQRCDAVLQENIAYEKHLKNHTRIEQAIAVTDFRELDPVPEGNRFLVYSLFPESMVSVKIRYKNSDKNQVLISIGKNIFNHKCEVNIGKLLASFGGGGHDGAGGCTLDAETADRNIERILKILFRNAAS
jgi:hypothetical protein